ncbi:MAG: hypothetical protein ABIO70_34935 [Pseudomonadota bacterium]
MDPTFDLSRRGLLIGGCGLAAVLAVPLDAEAGLLRATPAPRHRCPHAGCRYFRADGEQDGICALSLHGDVVPTPEVSP